MLTWLMNMGFAGGGVVTTPEVVYRRSGLKRRSGYAAWAMLVVLILAVG